MSCYVWREPSLRCVINIAEPELSERKMKPVSVKTKGARPSAEAGQSTTSCTHSPGRNEVSVRKKAPSTLRLWITASSRVLDQ
jgi:hypothetical protein